MITYTAGRSSISKTIRLWWRKYDINREIAAYQRLQAAAEEQQSSKPRLTPSRVKKLIEETKTLSPTRIPDINPEELQIHLSNLAIEELRAERRRLRFFALLDEADDYFLSLPDPERIIPALGSVTEARPARSWREYEFHFGLTPKEHQDLLKALDDKRRERSKARGESVVQIITLLIGLAGAITGIIALLKK